MLRHSSRQLPVSLVSGVAVKSTQTRKQMTRLTIGSFLPKHRTAVSQDYSGDIPRCAQAATPAPSK